MRFRDLEILRREDRGTRSRSEPFSITGPMVTLGVGEEFLHRIGEQVRRRVPDHVQALGIPFRDDGELRVAIDAIGRVDQLSVDLAAECGLGEPRPDGRGDLSNRHGLFEFPDRAVRERDGNHIRVVPAQAGIQSGLK
jgi:hypothetical protein